eukprot:CAMPEP_0185531770 /NCGR_PEP_ID=MMETSP1366-20130426/107568_1 /TAXON_ID=38817 /ORGANISM="Gephyrocapsa oceanica, Strain RCC1303" /LENGTH=157 /DNA_ID=CAMNT_0028143497 /DNA_START=19 /DNA_END=488 /DNA_ORIENTATION=+
MILLLPALGWQGAHHRSAQHRSAHHRRRGVQLHAPSPPKALQAVQAAFLRTLCGTAAGVAAGSALHAAYPARGLIDGALTAVDVSGGALLGGTLGVLWAAEAALLGSGFVASTVRAATGVLGEDRDRAAGERMLSDVRRSLETLQQVDGPQGALLRA